MLDDIFEKIIDICKLIAVICGTICLLIFTVSMTMLLFK